MIALAKGARRKRSSRPWQNPEALRDIKDILGDVHGEDKEYQVEGYDVRYVPSYRATKEYLCPDCGNAVPEGEAHYVVFPESYPDMRRHWHSYCWRAEAKRSNKSSSR